MLFGANEPNKKSKLHQYAQIDFASRSTIHGLQLVLELPDLDGQVEDERQQDDDDEGQGDCRRVAGLL